MPVTKPKSVPVVLAGASALVVLAAPAAHAAGVGFNGLITSSCALTIGLDGTLTTNPGGTTLASNQSGGSAATALILSTASTYKLEVDPVTSFTLAPTGGQPDAVAVTYNATGVTTVTARAAGTPLNLGLGLTNVTVDLSATKSSGIFPSGLYHADVVMRCVTQ